MNCERSLEMMNRHLDGELSREEEQAMLHHLASCRQCSEMFERLTGLERELANLPKVTPPYSIVDAMLPQLDRLAAEAKAKETADRTAVGRPGRPEHTAARRIEDRAQRRRPAAGLWKWAGGAAAAAAVFAVVLFVADGMPVRHAEDAVRAPEPLLESVGSGAGAASEIFAAEPDSAARASENQSSGSANDAGDPHQSVQQKAVGGTDTKAAGSGKTGFDGDGSSPRSLIGRLESAPSAARPGNNTGGAPTAPQDSAPSEPAADGPAEAPAASVPGAPATGFTADSPTEDVRQPAKEEATADDGFGLMAVDPIPPEEGEAGGGTDRGTITDGAVDGWLTSADGNYRAGVRDGRVVVAAASGSIVFVSAVSGDENADIRLIEWTGEHRLIYEIDDGRERVRYLLDLAEGRETKLAGTAAGSAGSDADAGE